MGGEESLEPPISVQSLNRRASRLSDIQNELILHEAVIKNDVDAVRAIMKEPVDVNFRNNTKKNMPDVNRKFVAITVAWMTLLTTFLIRDIQKTISWNPTQFFSMKVITIFPNDFYCMRLIHNIEIWVVLIMCLKSCPRLPNIVENFGALGFTKSRTGFCASWTHLKYKQRNLILIYALITTSPITFELFLLFFETNNVDVQQLLQGTLHCIPLTVNLQFCSLCILLAFQFENLNEHLSRTTGCLTPMNVQQISQKHSEICNLTRQIYKIYELQLLAETTIVTATVFLYTYYALNPSNLIWDGYGEVFYCGLWILHYAGRLFTTCMSVSKVMTQADNTSKVVLLMEENYHLANSHDEVTSLVNRVQNQDIRFDVCGFFHLEGALIVSVGRAPIHWASSRGNIQIMEMLISANCNIEAKDKFLLEMASTIATYCYTFRGAN